MLRVTTRDVGLTQAATLWVGDTKVVEFYTGTRHDSYSLEIAEEIVAGVLRSLISDKVPIYKGDDQ